MGTQIHETAVVSAGAKIGPGVEIGAFSIVEEDVEIGEGCRIASHVVLRSGTALGREVFIDSFTAVGGLPQDLGFDQAKRTFVRIGKGTTIREGSTVSRATREGEATVIGENCFLMAVSHVAHDCVLGDGVILGNNCMLAGFVAVGDDVFMGGGAGVHQNCRVGEGVMVGGGAEASVDVPPYTLFVHRNTVYGLNVVGLRRRKHSAEAVSALKTCYREVYLSGASPRPKAEELLKSPLCRFREAENFLRFFVSGKRGIARPRRVQQSHDS